VGTTKMPPQSGHHFPLRKSAAENDFTLRDLYELASISSNSMTVELAHLLNINDLTFSNSSKEISTFHDAPATPAADELVVQVEEFLNSCLAAAHEPNNEQNQSSADFSLLRVNESVRVAVGDGKSRSIGRYRQATIAKHVTMIERRKCTGHRRNATQFHAHCRNHLLGPKSALSSLMYFFERTKMGIL
jgi:hypothetical protein